MFFANFAIAQVNMNRYIELTVQQGEWIKFGLAADSEDTKVQVVSGTYDTTLTVGTFMTEFKNYYAQGSTMRIYGNIKEFDCRYNFGKITGLNPSNNIGLKYLDCSNNYIFSLDVSNLTALEILNCNNIKLSSLDVSGLTALWNLKCDYNNISNINISGCGSLSSIYCYRNNLSACGLDSIFHQLPIRPANNKGKIRIKYASNTNPGTSTCRDTIATNRNWEVLDYDGNLAIVNSTYACPYFSGGGTPTVNMSRWIDLNVTAGQWISLDLYADAANTGVKVVSGTRDTTLTVDDNWTDFKNYYAEASTMRVYGNINKLDCMNNNSKITGLDASNNTKLAVLYCHNNNLSTINTSGCDSLKYIALYGNNLSACGLDSLFRQLPIRPADNKGRIDIKSGTYTNPGTSTCRDTIATNRNWNVWDNNGALPIVNTTYGCPDFSGGISCPPVSNLTAVDNGDGTATLSWINPPQSSWPSECDGSLVFGFYNNTTFISFSNIDSLISSWTTPFFEEGTYTFKVVLTYYRYMGDGYSVVCEADTVSVSVYIANVPIPEVNMNRWVELNVQQGQWIKIDLYADANNTGVKVVSGANDTTLRVNADWTGFINYYAEGSTMKVYGNVKEFECGNNGSNITGVDASNNSGLIYLLCYTNNLSSLDVSGLTALEGLYWAKNNLSYLDLTNLTALKYLSCHGNNISSIKASGCESLRHIYCYGNNLSACGLDSIFHQLPIRPGSDKGLIYIKDLANTNPGAQTCRDTMATNRNWEVLDYNNGYGSGINIVNTSYDCPDFSIIEEMSANSLEINIYPNPVNDNLNIECVERINNLELYDALGRMLIRKENILDNISIDVSNLDSGIYILKIRTEKGSGEYKVIVE